MEEFSATGLKGRLLAPQRALVRRANAVGSVLSALVLVTILFMTIKP